MGPACFIQPDYIVGTRLEKLIIVETRQNHKKQKSL